MTRAKTIDRNHTRMVPYLVQGLVGDQGDLGEVEQLLDDNTYILYSGRYIVNEKPWLKAMLYEYRQGETILLHRKKNFFYCSTSQPFQCFWSVFRTIFVGEFIPKQRKIDDLCGQWLQITMPSWLTFFQATPKLVNVPLLRNISMLTFPHRAQVKGKAVRLNHRARRTCGLTVSKIERTKPSPWVS